MDIIFEQVEHRYQRSTPFERLAIYDINVSIESGKYYAIIGHTGSGKSTIIQHLNGLLQPTEGMVKIGDFAISAKKKEKKLKPLRKRVGVVFQFPEHQLFEETVEKDICYGPQNFGMSETKAKAKAAEVIEMVGLSPELLGKSPFELSGGQMRRVAIAGVLAMSPEVLVLDEPTAGLDPKGQKDLMKMFDDLHRQQGITVVLVTHNMEDAAAYADEIIVMDKGTVFLKGTPNEVFAHREPLEQIGVSIPITIQYKNRIEEKFGVTLSSSPLTIEQLAEEVVKIMNKGDA